MAMATGQQRRIERLNERLRGAQRANIQDDSFNLDIAGLNIAGSTPAAPALARATSSERRTLNIPAKTRRLYNERSPSAQGEGGARRLSPRSSYDLPETSKEPGTQDTTVESREEEELGLEFVDEPEEPEEEVEPEPQPEPGLPSPEVEAPDENEAEVALPVLPDNEPSEQPSHRRESRRSLEQIAQDVANERQDVRMSQALFSTTRLHIMLQEYDAPPSSSSLGRKVRRKVAEPEVEEVEDEAPAEEEAQVEQEVAEAIDDVEAAETIGRKRLRRSLPSQSPVAEPNEQAEEEEAEEPTTKRRCGRRSGTPATQKQPATKSKPTNSRSRTTQERPLLKQVRKTKKAAKERRVSDSSAFEVTVQRFVNVKNFTKGDNEEKDHFAADLPFTTTGVTTVDVFAQACLEVINGTVAKLFEALQITEEKDKKKERRIKIWALEAYKEELTSRLLQLAEGEQVALKMDAIRIKHDDDTKESKLGTSAIMHDIDTAVERGRDVPELSRAQEKKADLANLELLVSRITDEATSSSSAGGMLQQVKKFNAVLERAEIALETK
ncbi:hypothetical protein FGLOB1_3275 [Fusarium globosum]|uniref:Kinetochore protein n=1 Tax=Fusarium globosum TaxID=78864 RepID=A0A8H6DHE6_9HYPO|nr:hypothetical protein FGLOB1_3275 [Fusarium globosum]